MFHVGAIIELIENDDLMNEEEEEVKFNKLSVLFHPKKERKREREKKKHTHHRAVKNLIDHVCLKTTRRRGALPSTEKKTKNSADDDA